MVIVPLKKTVKIALIYLAVNLATMGLYNVPWFIRYVVILVVALAAFKMFYPDMKAVLKMIKKKK